MTSPSESNPAVVTRFAPSPTGSLHIGGARTALFNYLYAKRHNGKFLVRVEDTDRERSTDAAVKAIFDGLSWLELFADEEPVFQYSRADRHREVVNELLQRGGAYRDFTSAEETGRLRDLAKAEQRLAALDKACLFSCDEYRDLKAAVAAFKANGNKYVAK